LQILLCDPDHEWALQTKGELAKQSVEAITCFNGKDCQLKVYKTKYDAVVLDILTENNTALEVLRYLKLNHPGIKVILTLANKEGLKHIDGGTENLRRLGVKEVLVKPYSIEDLHNILFDKNPITDWRIDSSGGPDNGVESDDDEFTRIHISKFYSEDISILDYYIKLASGNYVKLVNAGEVFGEAEIKRYKDEKNVEFLFFKKSDRFAYITNINLALGKLLSAENDPPKSTIKTFEGVIETYLSETYISGINGALMEEGKKLCENIFNIVQKDKYIATYLNELESKHLNPFILQFLTAFYTAIICKNLDWSTRRTTEFAIFGALMHQIGKLNLPPGLDKIRYNELGAAEKSIFETYPRLGADILGNFNTVPEAVRQVVYQHRELSDGTGFPSKLRSHQIYPLAKIVSIASDFAAVILEQNVTPLDALRDFVTDRRNALKYDPTCMKALIMGFMKK